jgi:hypothetical protein
MIRPFMLLSCCIVALTLVACESDDSQEVGQLPTRVVIPTETPSATFTPTPPATNTETPLPTLTPSITPTTEPSATETPPPSATSAPTATPSLTNTPRPTRIRATATNTLTPTPPATNTPTTTNTPPATSTAATPQIIRFDASATTVAPNNPITLSWESAGDIARIDQTNINGVVQQTFSVPPNGQLPVSVPATAEGQVVYRLVVIRAGQEAARSIIINLTQTCATPWFFEGQPPVTECPAGPASQIQGSFQSFDRGLMFALNVNGADRVYGLNYSNNRLMVYQNNWDGTTDYTGLSPCGDPPTGRVAPQNVFSWMYYQQLGTTGPWCNGDLGIGWPLAGANLNVTLQVQFTADGQAFYVNVPTVGSFRIAADFTLQTGTFAPVQ